MHVYCVTNNIDGKEYIGQHSGENLDKYWRHCVKHALNGQDPNRYLYNAIRKHGPEAFSIRSLFTPKDKEEMDLAESCLIQLFRTQDDSRGYNITSGGQGMSGFHRPHTEEEKQHMSQVMKGRVLTESWKKRIADAQKGRQFTDDHKAKLSAAAKGVPKAPRSEEYRKHISEHKKAWWASRKATI